MINFFKKKKDLLPLLRNFVQQVKERTILTTDLEEYSAVSYQPYNTAIVQLERYLNGKPLYISDFTEEMLRDFVQFQVNSNCAMNSIAGNTKHFLTMMNRLINENIIVLEKDQKIPEIKLKKEITTAVYTTEEELQRMIDIDLSLTEKLKRVRDIYVIQCYVGLRFSDMIKVAKKPKLYYKESEGRSFFEIKSQKTNQALYIPLKPIVVEILKENKFSFRNGFSIQHYNHSLKELAEYAGIDDEIIKYMTIGGKRQEIIKRKYEMISSHTARRSFATNAYLSGVPIAFIRKITGHTTEESFMRYIRSSGLEVALKIHDYEFFK